MQFQVFFGEITADIQTDLTAYWKLDEASGARADSVGSETLTDNGSVGDVAGIIGNAASFSGSNNLVRASDAVLDIGTGTPFTFTLWANFGSTAGVQALLSKYGGSGTYLLYYFGGWNFYSNGVFTSPSGNPAATAGTWYFVAFGYDGVNFWVSVNVGTRGTGAGAGAQSGTDDFTIGCRSDGTQHVTGAIDEVAFYKGRSLADADLAALYNGGAGARPSFAAAPVANFTGTPLSGAAPLSVAFTDASTNTPTSWLWEKNSGAGWVNFAGTPTAQNPTESFAAGTWSVRLTATNATGSDTQTRTNYVASTSGRLLRGACDMDGLGGVGATAFNPSLEGLG